MRISEAFNIWWDRHNGHGWCWRESNLSTFRTGDDDVTEGFGLLSRRDANEAIQQELALRQKRKEAAHG